ncbi:MAG: glycosyltransferase family 9 protein [Alphaproteobacteria bacterium]
MNILFVTATRIGDAVLSTGLLSHLLDSNPGARVTIACGAPAAPLFGGVPGLDRLIVIEKWPFHLHWLALWQACIGTRWDVAVDLRGSALTRLLRAKRRIVMPYRENDLHRVVELGRMAGLEPPPAPALWLSDAARDRAAALVPDGSPVLGVGPTANWSGKQWPADRFAGLAARATAADGLLPGARVAVFGAPSERQMAAPVLDAIPDDRRIDLVGEPLDVAAACLARAVAFVGNDSGLMHVAAAAGVPTLGLFGPSPDARYGPWGPHCRVARTPESYRDLVTAPDFDHRSQKSLMTSLTVDAAYAALADLYANVKNVS